MSEKSTELLLDIMERCQTGEARLKGLLPEGTVGRSQKQVPSAARPTTWASSPFHMTRATSSLPPSSKARRCRFPNGRKLSPRWPRAAHGPTFLFYIEVGRLSTAPGWPFVSNESGRGRSLPPATRAPRRAAGAFPHDGGPLTLVAGRRGRALLRRRVGQHHVRRRPRRLRRQRGATRAVYASNRYEQYQSRAFTSSTSDGQRFLVIEQPEASPGFEYTILLDWRHAAEPR